MFWGFGLALSESYGLGGIVIAVHCGVDEGILVDEVLVEGAAQLGVPLDVAGAADEAFVRPVAAVVVGDGDRVVGWILLRGRTVWDYQSVYVAGAWRPGSAAKLQVMARVPTAGMTVSVANV